MRVLLLASVVCAANALHIDHAGLRPLRSAAQRTATIAPSTTFQAKSVAAPQPDALRLKGGSGEQV